MRHVSVSSWLLKRCLRDDKPLYDTFLYHLSIIKTSRKHYLLFTCQIFRWWLYDGVADVSSQGSLVCRIFQVFSVIRNCMVTSYISWLADSVGPIWGFFQNLLWTSCCHIYQRQEQQLLLIGWLAWQIDTLKHISSKTIKCVKVFVMYEVKISNNDSQN